MGTRTIRFALLVVGLLALTAAPVHAQSAIDKPTALLEAASNTLGLLEIAATEACIQQGACYERNPVMPDGPGRSATVGRALIKGAGNAASTWVILKVSKRSPGWARVASIGKIALNGWLAARALDYHRDR